MTVEDLVEKLIAECNPYDAVLVDYAGCVYEALSIRVEAGKVIIYVV